MSELPFAVSPRRANPLKISLDSTELRFHISNDRRMVYIELVPDGVPFAISVPWEINDFRLMLSRWLQAINEATSESNGVT